MRKYFPKSEVRYSFYEIFLFTNPIFLKVDPKPAVPQGPGMQSKPLVSEILKRFIQKYLFWEI